MTMRSICWSVDDEVSRGKFKNVSVKCRVCLSLCMYLHGGGSQMSCHMIFLIEEATIYGH